MSDDNAQDGLPPDVGGDTPGDGEAGAAGAVPDPVDPSLAGRLDAMHRSLSTLGMRIDALVTSTTTYRTALTDRLTEYAEVVTKLTRTQAADLEEYRQSNERTLAELRRGLAGSDELLERLAARLDAMTADTGAADDQSRQVLSEVRSILEAQDDLSRFLTESLDQFGERVLGQLTATQAATTEQLDALRDTLAGADSDDSRVAATGVLEEIRETLLDVASGEVVGALWDEFRAARTSIDEILVSVQRAEDAARTAAERTPETGPSEEDSARIEALVTEVTALEAAVRDLLAQAEVVDEHEEAPRDDAMLTAMAADVATLRRELSQGLVVEPSDALAGAVDQLRADVAGLDDRLTGLTALQEAIAELRSSVERLTEEPPTPVESADDDTDDAVIVDEVRAVHDGLAAVGERLGALTDLERAVAALREELQAAGEAPEAAAVDRDDLEGELATLRSGIDVVDGELRTVRSGIEDIIARLDEGLVLAEDVAPPASAAAGDDTADQLAALRDQITTEFDALRDALEAGREPAAGEAPPSLPAPEVDLSPVTEALDRLRDDLAGLPDRIEIPEPPAPPPAPAPAPPAAAELDPAVLESLREEIRAAGAVPDDLLDQLRKELVALRRRIRLRAEGEIFTDEQLQLIAEAVARKLAERPDA